MGKGYCSIRRYSGQRIFVGSDLEIRVGEVKGDYVQILLKSDGLLYERPTSEEDADDRAEAIVRKKSG